MMGPSSHRQQIDETISSDRLPELSEPGGRNLARAFIRQNAKSTLVQECQDLQRRASGEF